MLTMIMKFFLCSPVNAASDIIGCSGMHSSLTNVCVFMVMCPTSRVFYANSFRLWMQMFLTGNRFLLGYKLSDLFQCALLL